MQIKQPLQFTQGISIAAGLFLALGAISLFFRPNPAGLGEAAPLPPDYLDICRAAGI